MGQGEWWWWFIQIVLSWLEGAKWNCAIGCGLAEGQLGWKSNWARRLLWTIGPAAERLKEKIGMGRWEDWPRNKDLNRKKLRIDFSDLIQDLGSNQIVLNISKQTFELDSK
jgi:hypothetical protein